MSKNPTTLKVKSRPITASSDNRNTYSRKSKLKRRKVPTAHQSFYSTYDKNESFVTRRSVSRGKANVSRGENTKFITWEHEPNLVSHSQSVAPTVRQK